MQKKQTLAKLFLVTIIIWAVWLPLSTSGNFRMDSDRMIYHAEEALSQYIGEGRFGLVALLHVFGLTTWNPVLSGVLFLIFFSLSAWILCYFIYRFSDQSHDFPYVLFALIYATTPVWAFHIYFVLQIAAVGFGIMLTALLAGLDTKHHTNDRKWTFSCLFYELLSTLLLAFSLSIYQGLIVYYMSAAAVFFFCYLLRGNQCSIRQILVWGLRVLISLALYLFTSRMLQGGSSAYLTQQIQWGQIPLIQCLINIVIQFGKMVLLIYSGSTSLYPLAIILFAIFMYRRWKTHPAEKKQNGLLLLAGAAILLLPMAMSILQGSRPVPRTQFGLQIAAAFIPACYLAYSNGRHTGLRVLCVIAICFQIILNVRLFHTDQVRNQQDTQTIQTISISLEDAPVESKPLIFLGSLPFQDDSILMEKTDVFGRSFFEWIYDANVPGSATSSAVRLFRAFDNKNYTGCYNPILINEATALAQTMPSYPHDGYWLETEDYILIKLSENN